MTKHPMDFINTSQRQKKNKLKDIIFTYTEAIIAIKEGDMTSKMWYLKT